VKVADPTDANERGRPRPERLVSLLGRVLA
jgi:hypothetical protein